MVFSATSSNNQQHMTSQELQWWGEFTFEYHQIRAWKFGSLLMRLSLGSQEWQLEYHRPRTQNENEQFWEKIDPQTTFATPATLERYLFSKVDNTIKLSPRMADRPVIIRPVNPIFIPAGQKGTLFVSTPLWIAGWINGQKKPLFDMPILRPNDSWFGKNTLHGQLCYASNVFGRTQLAHLPPRPFRAVTSLHFHNKGAQQIPLTRMNLPVQSLSLYFSPETGRLWTSSIEVIHDDRQDIPKIIIDDKPPIEAGKTILLDKPRDNQTAGLFSMFEL